MINSWELKKYTRLDHEIWLFTKQLEPLLRAYQAKGEAPQGYYTIVLWEDLKCGPGFFSPKPVRPARQPGVNTYWLAQPSLVEFYTNNSFFEPLVEVLSSYGYEVKCSECTDEQFTKATRLTIKWIH